MTTSHPPNDPSSLGSAMHALIHCSGWTRTVLLTSKVKERDVARTCLSYTRLHLSKARRKCQSLHRFRHDRDPFAAALHQAAKASKRSENRALTFEQCQSGASPGLRIDPLTHTHKDFGRAQHEMSSSGDADKCLWFIGAFEQLLRQIYRGDAILVSVNDQNRDMNVTNREVRTKLVEHHQCQ